MASPNLTAGQVQIDYIAADFNSVVDDLITFASTNYGPGTPSNRLWSDFNVSSFSRTWLELVGYVSDIIFYYLDNQATEAYLESATLRSSVLNIANQFGYVIPTASSSAGIATFTTSGNATIPSGFIVTDNAGNSYFTTQTASISGAGTLSVPVIQGVQATDNFVAQGIQNETFQLSTAGLIVDSTNIVPTLRSPIVTVNSVTWTQVNSFIESFPTSQNYIIGLQPNGQATIMFGDGIMGQQLTANQAVQVSYRTGGGTIGNISATQLVSLGSSATNVVSVTNLAPFSGGTDAPTISQLQQLIPASLSTLERAVTAPDYGNIVLLNFPQVQLAQASVANVQTGIDLDIYIVPTGTSVTPITANPNLLTSIGNFINLHKMVTTQFQILNGLNLALLITIKVYVSANSSRSVVSTNINNALNTYFAFATGTISPGGTGPTFGQEVLLANVYEILDSIAGIDRYEVKKLTYQPNEVARVNNINQLSFSDIEVLPHAGKYEYFIATEAVPPNPSGSNIGQYEVFQREYFTISNIADNSISDNTSSFSVLEGTGNLVDGNIVEEQDSNVFIVNQYASGFLLVDSLNNVFKIESNDATSITINPTPINPDGSSFVNGLYNIVRDYRDLSYGGSKQRSLLINNNIISVAYNNVNTFFVIPGAELNTIGTIGDPFILSTKLTLPAISVSVTSTSTFPTIQVSPVLATGTANSFLEYPVGMYSAYNPITGTVFVQNSVDLTDIVPGDQLVDSLGNNYQILSDIITSPPQSFNIKTLPQLISSFQPSSYNSFSGFISVPDSIDLSNVTTGDVFIDYSNIQYVILGGVSNTTGSKGFDIQPEVRATATDLADSIVFTANNYGTIGNSIILIFSGSDTVTTIVNTWNSANPSNTVSFTGSGSVIPTAQTINLSGGVNAPTPNLAVGATIYGGISQVGNLQIVGQGNISNVQAGDVLVDVNGDVSLIDSVNILAGTVTVDPNSNTPAIGTADIASTNSLPVPLISTSVSPTSISNVFELGTYLTGSNAKIIPGDLLVDADGVINEIAQFPYVTYNNSSATSYTYTTIPNTVTVFDNANSIEYTYNPSSGTVEYASNVDLSAVDLGDQFQGNGSYASAVDTIDTPNITFTAVEEGTVGNSISLTFNGAYATYTDTLDTPNIVLTADTIGSIGNSIALTFDGVQATGMDSSSTITFTAVNAGIIGNSISLVFSGSYPDEVDNVVFAWNTANPNNQVSYTPFEPAFVPTAQTVVLTGGSGTSISSIVGTWNTANPSNEVSYTGSGSIVPIAQSANLSGGTGSTIDAIVDAWNSSNPSNQVSYTGLSSVIPTAQTINLSGGVNALYYTIFAIDYATSTIVIPTGLSITPNPAPGGGGSIQNGSSRGLIQYASSIDFGLTSSLDVFLDSNNVTYTIDTFSTALNIVRINSAPATIGLAPGALSGGSIKAYNLVELSPGFTTPTTGPGATITRRYYSPGNGVTWVVSYNGFNSSEGFLDINDLGLEPTTSNPADQFTIRTSPWCADITNVRDQEVPTLNPNNITLDLRGGNP